jgi:3-oxoacyl-[acyl-carrier protein] reductase
MDLHLKNKIALVCGASKGIGFAIARGLAAENARVVLCARHEAELQKAVETIRIAGGEAFGKTADVSDPEQIEGLIQACQQRFGSPDILISNAGGPPTGKAAELSDAAWFKGYDLTLMSTVRLARAVTPAMKAKNWGRIINITSLSIKQPVPNLTLSNAFRAAVTGFAKTLSSELAAFGITVNNLGPGYTATERLQELFQDEAAKERLIQTIPAKRFGSPEEIASAAIYLASQQAAYITGQTLIVDGGVIGATY